MFIRKLTIENFKGFEGKHEFLFNKNLVFFVGDNNCGKSTILESVEFLRSGVPSGKSLSDIKNNKNENDVTVTAEFHGKIREIINDFSEKKYIKYVFEDDEVEKIFVRRSSKEETVKQDGKDKLITIKAITLWNPETKQFENPSGVDTVFRSLFEAQFVWADTNPEDITDFGATKICGRLLSSAIGNFFESTQWKKFSSTFDETFSTGSDNFCDRTKQLSKKINDVINEQYGHADVSFSFELPEISSFIKTGSIDIDDGSGRTSSKEKGNGMQRALALALIQIYADILIQHPEDPSKTKPLFLYIDEPETFLHPRAQGKFLNALNIISESRQIVVCTHSPYLLRHFNKEDHALYIFSKKGTSNCVESSQTLDLFEKSSPTWGEINYNAFGLLSPEFHNELYGFLQAKATVKDSKNEKSEEFDKFLRSTDSFAFPINVSWIHEKSTGDTTYNVTLSTYIRNYIHHPENLKNKAFSDSQLQESIDIMIKVIKNLN